MTKTINALIFLPVLCLIGAYTSYDDLRFSRIKNSWILLGLGYSAAIYAAAWAVRIPEFWGQAGPLSAVSHGLTWNFDKWCINLAFSGIAAYSLWHFNLWGAGDAKLFICYAALIPMTQYPRVYFHYYFASFFLLLAIFIPASLPTLARSVSESLRLLGRREPGWIREKFAKLNKKKTVRVLTGFLVLFLLMKMLSLEYQRFFNRNPPNPHLSMIAFLFIFRFLSGFFKKYAVLTVVAFFLLVLYFTMSSESRLFTEIVIAAGKALLTMVLFPLFRAVVDVYSEPEKQNNISFALWMFLGALIVWVFPGRP